VNPRKQLGLNVCRLRNRAGLTQEQLCEAASIDRSYLQRIETGTMNPSFDVLWRLVKALKASWLDVLFGIEKEPPAPVAPPAVFPHPTARRASFRPKMPKGDEGKPKRDKR
jgi:transcriptional regulator with XRE-family HTH domain